MIGPEYLASARLHAHLRGTGRTFGTFGTMGPKPEGKPQPEREGAEPGKADDAKRKETK
jgi:hypothetical protein